MKRKTSIKLMCLMSLCNVHGGNEIGGMIKGIEQMQKFAVSNAIQSIERAAAREREEEAQKQANSIGQEDFCFKQDHELAVLRILMGAMPGGVEALASEGVHISKLPNGNLQIFREKSARELEAEQKRKAKMLETISEEEAVRSKKATHEEEMKKKISTMQEKLDELEPLPMQNEELERQILELREALEARSNSSRSGRTSRSSSSKVSSSRYQELQARHDELLLALEDRASRSSSSKSNKTSRSSSSKSSARHQALQAECDQLRLALADRESRSSSSRPRTPSEMSVETTPSIEVWTRDAIAIPTPQDLSPRSVDSRTEPAAPSESASSASTWIIPPSL